MNQTTTNPSASVGDAPSVSPLRELWAVAWPTVLTMTSYTVMQFVDSKMVSVLGSTELAAQGNGAIASFAPLAFAMGLLSIVSTYVSQNLGAGTPERAPRYAWNAMWFAAGVWLLLIPYGLALPRVFAAAHGHDPELVRLESLYGQVLVFTAALPMWSRGLSHFFYGMHRPRVILVATVIGNVANVFLNWVLIFGHLGAPAMGVLGAAIGTVIGTAIEFGIPLAVFLGPRMNREFRTRRAWRINGDAIRDLARVGWPKSAMFGNEIICWAIFMNVLVGAFGTDHMAAGWIALRYMHLSFMPALGISVAVTAVVGKYIGAGRPDVAAHRARLGVRMAMTYMGVCALAFVGFRYQLAGFFTDEAAIVRIAGALLICAAIFQLFDALGITYSGALSGAGDTVVPGVMAVVASWVFIVGLGGLLVRLAPGWESVGPWVGASVYIGVFGSFMWWRWRSGRWRAIDLLGRAAVKPCPECGDVVGTVESGACPTCGWRREQIEIAEDVAADVARERAEGEADEPLEPTAVG